MRSHSLLTGSHLALPGGRFMAADTDPSGTAPAVQEKPPEKPLTLSEKLSAAISSKGALQREIDRLTVEGAESATEIERLSAVESTLTGHLEKANASIVTLQGDLASANNRIEEMKAGKAQEVKREAGDLAAEIVGSKGFKAESLPTPTAETQGDDGESLKEQFRAEKDPVKRGELATAIARLNSKPKGK